MICFKDFLKYFNDKLSYPCMKHEICFSRASPCSIFLFDEVPFFTKIFFSPLKAILGITDLSVDTEVWNDVVSWGGNSWFVCFEVGHKLMVGGSLGCFDVVLSIQNFMWLSEIWNDVVNWVASIGWCLMIFERRSVSWEKWFSGKLDSRGAGNEGEDGRFHFIKYINLLY